MRTYIHMCNVLNFNILVIIMKKFLFYLIFVNMSIFYVNSQASAQRVILFMIDGLHWEAPQKANMPVFNRLAKEGTYIRKSYMIIPHHPTIGDYSKYNSCSFPNPVLHQGTIFLDPKNKMIQEIFSPAQQTAFIVNTVDYASVGRGFSTCIMDDMLTDEQVVEYACNILNHQQPVFMRVHLQRPGQRGNDISRSAPDSPYYRNIFAASSPYVEAVENADRLLGRFVQFLKDKNLWDGTVLIVTSDHGQSRIGWHSFFDEESWMTPLVFAGNAIAVGRELPYFEHTDIAPTIAGLLGKDGPAHNGGAGVFVKQILKNTDASGYAPVEYIKIMNRQILEFNRLRAGMIVLSKSDVYYGNVAALLENETFIKPFAHQDRILEWYKTGNTAALIELNETVLKQMRTILSQ